MNIKIIIKSNNLYCRLISGRQIDISKKLGISIPMQFWDKKNEKIKTSYNFENRDKINAKLYKLKGKITNKFNFDNINGEVIDGQWLEIAINEAFNKTVLNKGEKWKVYLLDFCQHWLENEGLKVKDLKSYENFVRHLTNFLKSKNLLKLKIKETTNKTIQEFIDFMIADNFSIETTKRQATRFKTFLHSAVTHNLQVDNNYKLAISVEQKTQDQTQEVKEIYLNEQEIESIYNLDYSHNLMLDNIRDNFIIGLHTGLRLSDFNNRLDINNIIDGFIEIKPRKTVKKGIMVSIPLHRYVIQILNKRNGNLPKKVNDVQFNESIKDVCQDAEINEITQGYVFDTVTKRNKLDNYKKHELVSSHICRRSFATNLFGKVPNYVIQAVGGWSTEKMMLHYIKKSNREQAEELKKYWDNNDKSN
jgi:site-specific recombinase XerD